MFGNDNVVVKKYGTITSTNTLDHLEITKDIDTDMAAKIAGSRFSVLKGELPKLQRALISLMIDNAIKNGYEEYYVPFMANTDSLIGTGQLPKFEKDQYEINSNNKEDRKFLIPTADKGTRAHNNPSSLMNEEYWTGSGTIDTPLHLLPITPPSQYTTPEFDELPSEWLHKSTVQLRPVSALLTVTCHRVETESEDHTLIPDTHNLNRLKVKYRSFDKLKRIMMHILKMSPAHKHMSAHQLIICL